MFDLECSGVNELLGDPVGLFEGNGFLDELVEALAVFDTEIDCVPVVVPVLVRDMIVVPVETGVHVGLVDIVGDTVLLEELDAVAEGEPYGTALGADFAVADCVEELDSVLLSRDDRDSVLDVVDDFEILVLPLGEELAVFVFDVETDNVLVFVAV